VLILNKKLIRTQWISLLVLVIGVALVQLSDSKETKAGQEQSRFKGFSAAITACVLSGLAGIYFEKILKGSDVSVWMRNVQLSLLSIPLGLLAVYGKHGDEVGEKGFFFGYDAFVWYLVCLNAVGGLLVAVVVKYADNILKGFACSLAIIFSAVLSIFLFGFQLSLQFSVGASLVIGSIFLYGYEPPKESKLPQRI
jgi:UDP-sugar transporter A1/2/3